MDTRKLISFGTSSYVVSVPKQWVQDNKLKKGDLLHVEKRNEELVLSRNEVPQHEPLRISIGTDGKTIERLRIEIISAYLNNYEIIEIYGKQLEQEATQVKEIIRTLSGLEVVQQTATRIIARDLINLREISITTLIRRVDNIIRSMLQDMVESFHQNHYESIYERDMEVNRLVFLAFRVIRVAMQNTKLARTLALSPLELLYSKEIISKLENIGDQAKRIARHIKATSTLTAQEREDLRNLAVRLNADYFLVMKAYYKRDLALAFQTEAAHKEVLSQCSAYQQRNNILHTAGIITNYKNLRGAIRDISRAIIGMGENPFLRSE